MNQKPNLSLQVDLVFKAMFGRDTKESNYLLIDLINTILNRSGDNKIKKVTIKNPFNTQENINDKLSILDIKAETDRGELIDIEMQMNYSKVFRRRSLYYWARLHSEQLNHSEKYNEIKKSICINILSEKCFHETEKSHYIFKVKERQEDFILSEDLEIHYVQLPLIDDTIEVKSMDSLTKWMTLFKDIHLSDKHEIIDELISEKGVMQLAYDEYSKVTEDELIREKLEARQKFIWDMNTEKAMAIEEGKEEGREIGREEGRQEGRQEGFQKGKLEVARNLLSQFDDKKISELTGIEIEIITDLRKLN